MQLIWKTTCAAHPTS